jgi:hypothetical protein
METTHIEQITGDNRRPGMKYPNGWLVRYNPHDSYGWLSCATFPTQEEAERFSEDKRNGR